MAKQQQGQQSENTFYGTPYNAHNLPQSSSPAPSTGSHPLRHVSVMHADAYPTPPAFRHRDSERPARLRSDSCSGSRASPPSQPQYVQPAEGEPILNPYPQYHQQYWAPPSRMTSTSTTAARRGSPPPPETPADDTPPVVAPLNPGARRGSTPRVGVAEVQGRNSPRLNATPHQPPPHGYGHSPNSELQLSQGQCTNSQQSITPPRRPWTPTESPGSYPHGPPTVWHGTGGQNSEENLRRPAEQRRESASASAPEPLEQDFSRMAMSASPPPSYASLSHAGGRPPAANADTTAQGYPDEKLTVVVGAAGGVEPTHPAFHNDPNRQDSSHVGSQTHSPAHPQVPFQHPPLVNNHQPQQQSQPQPQPNQQPGQEYSGYTQEQKIDHFAAPAAPGLEGSPAPTLPEGWMAHLDAGTGQYYYIHILSSHTQWEPPQMEPVPALPLPAQALGQVPPVPQLTHQPSHSSGDGTYVHPQHPQSPGFSPAGYSDSSSSVYAQSTTTLVNSPPPPAVGSVYGVPSSTSGYAPPPPPVSLPNSGIELYKSVPVNGEYFGPYLRYTNMDVSHGVWCGSILIVTEYQQAPTVHIHKSLDLSPNPRQLKAQSIFSHRSWAFFRYDIDLQMGDGPYMWTYAVSTPLGCTRFEFLVAGREERGWRFIAHSCNDFSLSIKSEERAKLGGHGFMWKDLMQKHLDCGGFHAQIGGGDQIYADRMWKEVQPLKEWLEIKGKENRKNAQWTTRHDDEVTHSYFHYYTSSWDQPHIREALAQIPYMFQIDDHDIFDGFGSYAEYMQFSNMFKNIGRIGMLWYLLFQHHTTLEFVHSRDEDDLFTITGTGWHFIKFLGPAVAVVGVDTRSERNQHQVLAGPTYQGLFPKIATLPSHVQHAIILSAVPLIYPRLDTAEHVVNTVATGKKAVTGTFNLMGKVVGSAAGVIGAKEVVTSGFGSVKKAVGKQGLMSSVVSVFGEVDLLDDLRDHWTHESKDLERTYLIRTLQGISHSRSLRITFLSGDVHVCGAGLVHDPNKPSDHKTMYQIISSGIVNAPPSAYVLRMLHSGSNRQLYIPQNGLRSTNAPSDTKEDMMELFQNEVDGRPREHKKLMGKRNYAIFTAFEADVSTGKNVSLAVDFIVQGESVYSPTGKYGPVVVPRLEIGW